MAGPASKRRKIERAASDVETDDASFASFGDSANEDDGFGDDDAVQEVDNDPMAEGEVSWGVGSTNSDRQSEPSEYEANMSIDTRNATQPRHTPAKVPRKTALDSTVYSSGTFKNTMFETQVEDLLGHIRPKHGKREIAAEDALHKLKHTIEKIPSQEPLSVDEAERQLLLSSKVAVPFPSPRPPKDAKYKLEYAKPSNINVVGSYAMKTASRAKGLVEIDLTVTMPSSMFQEKDYLDYRYFYKRAYYVACIAAALQQAHAKEFCIRFENLHDNELKPVLVVSPAQIAHSADEEIPKPTWRVKIIPCISTDVFGANKLTPDKTCVRSSTHVPPSRKSTGYAPAPTSFYNSSIRSDMLMTSYLKTLHLASKRCAAFRDACLLGSTWLRQRGFGSNIHSGGFGNFEFICLVALLLEAGGSAGRAVLSESYSSYQLFKATLQILANKDLSKEILNVGVSEDHIEPLVHGVSIVWDGVRRHNLLYKMTPWSYQLLKSEARITINMLSDESFDGFEAAFILRNDSSLYRYDYIMRVDASFVGLDAVQATRDPMRTCKKLYDVIQRGLGDRTSLVTIIPQWSQNWEVGFAVRSTNATRTLLVGFVVNPSTVHRTVDHGPSAEDKSEAASFRKFWGEKAELRRFKDGSILESLVWSDRGNGKSVLEQIVRYVVSRHLGEEAERNIIFNGDSVKKVLSQTPGVSAFQPLMEAYRQLEADIRSLDNLPLSIRQMMPNDAQLRSSSIDLADGSRQRLPANVTVQFEGSSRWPDDLVAIQRTKLAFLIKISEQLQASVNTLTARIGLENEEHDILNQAFLDIIYDSSAAFRLRIYHDRELPFLERKLKDKTLDPASKEITALVLAKCKRDYVKGPAFTQAIGRLCGRHPALSGTIRLAKKWFSSHLLSSHVADEVIEMLVARTFVDPWPWQTPSSVQTGFLRTLFWISRWDWRSDPLVVDLSDGGDLKQPQTQTIKTNFEAWRKLDPSLNRVVLFCGSNVDPDGVTWTDGRTPKVVAARMTALAKAACAEIQRQQLEFDPASLFSSPLYDFDFVVYLNIDTHRKRSHRKQSGTNGTTFKNLEMDTPGDPTFIGYKPMEEFLEELEKLYGTSILLFLGEQERPLIAGLWNPHTAPRSWKLNLGYSTVPKPTSAQNEAHAEINKEAILAEIARLGGSIVKRIEVNR